MGLQNAPELRQLYRLLVLALIKRPEIHSEWDPSRKIISQNND
jgi:hypothetical protein